MPLCPIHEARRKRENREPESPDSRFKTAMNSVAYPIILRGGTITHEEAWKIWADAHPVEAAEMSAQALKTIAAAKSGQR